MKKKDLEKYEKLLLTKRAEILGELGLLKKTFWIRLLKIPPGIFPAILTIWPTRARTPKSGESFSLASKSDAFCII